MKNCSPKAKRGPLATISAVSKAEARKVPRLAMTLRLGAQARSPTTVSSAPLTRGMASMRTKKIHRPQSLLQLFQVADVEAVELVADLEEEHAEDDHADQHVERDAQLHHHRHAVGGAGGGEEEAVLHGEEADHLRIALLRVIIIRKASITVARAMPRVPRLMVLDSWRWAARR
jgi:hypothetical protein